MLLCFAAVFLFVFQVCNSFKNGVREWPSKAKLLSNSKDHVAANAAAIQPQQAPASFSTILVTVVTKINDILVFMVNVVIKYESIAKD